jgi:hypothetical protein
VSKRPPFQPFHLGYSTRGTVAALSPPAGKQLKVYLANVQNRTGSAIDAGICVRFDPTSWSLGTLTAASTPDFADATATIQAGSDVSIFTTTNNDGFLVQSSRLFNVIGLTISQAESVSPVYEYTYYNGTTYATLTTISVPTTYGAANQWIVFPAPQDWVVGTTAAVGGSTTKYSIRVRATTAGGQAVKANAAWIGQFIAFQEGLADNGNVTLSFSELNPLILQANEGVMPYFGTANAANLINGFYALSD